MYVNYFICIYLEVNIYIQSTGIALPLLTFAHSCVASTSNPSRFLAPFGPQPASPQLQRPIQHGFFTHFGLPPCFPAALTSNPSRFLAPFGLLPCLPQLQRPIRHAFLLLLDFHMLPRSFNVQSTLSCSFWTSAMPPAALTSNPPRFLAPFGLLPCFPTASTSNPPRFLAHFGLLPCFPQL